MDKEFDKWFSEYCKRNFEMTAKEVTTSATMHEIACAAKFAWDNAIQIYI